MQIQTDITDFLKESNFFKFSKKMTLYTSFLGVCVPNCPIPPCIIVCVCAQSCLTLYRLTDRSPPGYVHRIFQARILEWVAVSYSRSSSRLKGGTWLSCVSCIGNWILYHWATWEAAPILEDKVKNKWSDILLFFLQETSSIIKETFLFKN